jgi:hypothetical protein
MSIKFKVEGKMSTFGGPKDAGVGPDEGLALVEEDEMSLYPDFFLGEAEAHAPGLARRLNPDKFYVACRWPSDLSRKFLQLATVQVSAAGKSADARAVDKGPSLSTGRAADLSPGLATFLGLETDDQCVITVDDQTSTPIVPDTHVIRFRRRSAHAIKKGRTLDGAPARIRNIVLHSSDGREEGDLATLTGADVSAHWYVTRDGRIFHLVNDEDTAFHAGQVFEPLFFSNAATVGIEQEHFDPDPPAGRPNNESWPDIQIETVAQLTAFLLEQHGLVSPDDIKTHARIASPKGRKQDPFGYPFDKFFPLVDENLKFEWRAEEI